jgi:hypothetical protein
MVEAGNYQVGLSSLQQGLITKRRDNHGSHATPARSGNARRPILHDHRLGWWDL